VRGVTLGCDTNHMPRVTFSLSSINCSRRGHGMTAETASAHLRYILEQQSEKVRKPKSSVLFRRGDKASGMFIVLSGKVRLDLGVDSALSHTCGEGALVGLPSTLTRRDYSMTATVTEDAELGYWTPEGLESLLREQPDLCHPLLLILGEWIAEERDSEREFTRTNEGGEHERRWQNGRAI